MLKISSSFVLLFTLISGMNIDPNSEEIDYSIGYLISNFDGFLGTEEYCDEYLQSAENLVDDLEDLGEDENRERIALAAELEEAKSARDFIAIFGDCDSNGACKKGFFKMVSRFGCSIYQIGDFPSCASIYEIEKAGFKSWIYIISEKKTSQVKYHFFTDRTKGEATMGSRGVPVH